MSTYFKKGDWNAICDVCGFKFKASELKKRWDGVMVCKSDWEPRHEQEFVRGVKDDPSVAWTRPEQSDNETDTSGWAGEDTTVPSGTFDGSL